MASAADKLGTLYDLQRYDEAIQTAMEIIHSNEGEKELAYSVAIGSFVGKDNFTKALELCNQALGEFPHSEHFMYQKAFILKMQKKYKEALAFIEKVLGIEPNNASYYQLQSQILNCQNKHTQAKLSIDKALALEPNDPDMQLTLAFTTYCLDNSIIACEIVENILKHHPNHAQALDLKSEICTDSLSKKATVLKNILFANPMEKYYSQKYESIKRYYQIAPVLMGLVLLSVGLFKLEYVQNDTMIILFFLAVSGYVYKDWRLALPFFMSVYVLFLGLSWTDIPTVVIMAFITYAVGMALGTYSTLAYEKLKYFLSKKDTHG
jgi:tetratricopeptide (TPR) repeat protein